MAHTPPMNISHQFPEKKKKYLGYSCADLVVGEVYNIVPRFGDSPNENDSDPHTLVSKTNIQVVFSPIGLPTQHLSIQCADIGNSRDTIRIRDYIVPMAFGKRKRGSKRRSNRRSKLRKRRSRRMSNIRK